MAMYFSSFKESRFWACVTRLRKKWYFVSKIVLTCMRKYFSDREKLLKFKLEGEEFAKIIRTIYLNSEMSVTTTIFETERVFNFFLEVSQI